MSNERTSTISDDCLLRSHDTCLSPANCGCQCHPSGIEALIEQSSLGTPEAKALRAQTPTSTARAIVLASKYLGRAERAEAMVAMLSESLTETCKRAEVAEATLASVADTAEGSGTFAAATTTCYEPALSGSSSPSAPASMTRRPTMAEHYTDEDVRVAYDAWDGQPAIPGNRDSMRAVLDAVAPTIAARALRDLAERMESPEWTHRDDWSVNCAYAFEVRARADEIEGR